MTLYCPKQPNFRSMCSEQVLRGLDYMFRLGCEALGRSAAM
eukprot:COSAG01_NODE_38371_length_490_cov_1.450128_1_plen_40_part_10